MHHEGASRDRMWRTRWAAIGAAVAVTLGAGGMAGVRAASSAAAFVAITPQRVVDTRSGIGLTGPFTGGNSRRIDLTGVIDVALAGGTKGSATVVPDEANAIVANVTVVRPTSTGYLSVRPGSASGVPSTSSVNVTSVGGQYPNAVTVAIPTSGSYAGAIDLYFFADQPGGTADVLLDIVGYYLPGSTGATGATGPTGPPGPRGLSAWETVPSGVTITGEIVWDTHLSETGDTWDYVHVPFPAKIPTPYGVSFAGNWPWPDPGCTGTYHAPTAPVDPVGIVCVYVDDWGGYDPAETWLGDNGLPDQGFALSLSRSTGSDGSDAYFYATWAYRAP